MHSEIYSPIHIIQALKDSSLSRLTAVSVLDICSSTNDYLFSCKSPIKTKFNLCIARTQSAGRGRYGKVWHSQHNGIYLSISWQTTSMQTNEGWLLLMTAVRLAEMLNTLGVSDIGIKWPNDLYYKNAKLAGMLIERRGNLTVMGIGLNIASPSTTASIANMDWTGLEQTDIELPTYCDLLSLIVDVALKVDVPIAYAEDQRRFSQFDILYNKAIEIDEKGKKLYVIARGIDKKARLLVAHKGRAESYNYKEISIHYDRITHRYR